MSLPVQDDASEPCPSSDFIFKSSEAIRVGFRLEPQLKSRFDSESVNLPSLHRTLGALEILRQ